MWLNKLEEFTEKPEWDISETDISQFKDWLQKRYSEKSIEYAITIVHNYFSYLRLKEFKCLNPGLIKSPRARANSHQAISPEDFQKILKVLNDNSPQNELKCMQAILIIRILGETGVRVSELTGLVIENIDLNICGALIETKKNTDKRWIYWSNQTNELLKKYLPLREKVKRGTRALFVSELINCQGITTRTVERIVKKCCKKAGVVNVVPHSFRHGTAHNILEKGGTVADVQKTLGHRSPLSSMKYLQYSDNEHRRRAKMFLQDSLVPNAIYPLQMLDNNMALGV